MKRSILAIGALAIVGFAQGAFIQNKLQAAIVSGDDVHHELEEGYNGQDAPISEEV
jgi:hypothetical protein